YDAALARERLAMIRELLPEAAIGTDLIAGFPGEDEAAFERTLAFVEESPFSYLHVFPYSLRSGTTAARLDGRNPPTTIAARARQALEAALGHRFERPEQLAVALTHRSFGEGENNEKLEFLGDAVLALAMADLLMARFPEAREGDLSKMRASLVNAGVLARKARELELGRWLRLGKGEEKSGGRDKPSLLAAVYEALLGAIYLDAGYERARAVVEAHFAADVLEHLSVGLRDYKTELQELTQRLFRETPAYTLVEESGPDHEKRFVSEIAIGGRWFGRGVGRSKKTAEQAAAMQALATLACQHPQDFG